MRTEHGFGWLLDARFPGLSVDNYGTGGYGTYQSLLLLEELFGRADFRPRLVIYGFAAFHGERNVGAYRHVVTLRTQVGERLAPPHVLIAQGELAHRAPFYIRGWPLEDRSALVSLVHLSQLRWTLRGREEQIEPVTQRLLARMDRLARDRGSRLLVAILEGQPREREGQAPYARFLQEQGIAYVDCIHPEYGDDPRLRLGGSGHPSPVLHAAWADCIAAWITANVPDATAAARTPVRVAGPDRCLVTLLLALPEEGHEPGLHKISVVGQRRGDVALLHDEKARAVRQAPTLVTSSSVPLHRSPELRVRLRNDSTSGLASSSWTSCTARLRRYSRPTRHVVEHFGYDHLGCHDPKQSQLGSRRLRPFVQRVSVVQVRYEITRVSENHGH